MTSLERDTTATFSLDSIWAGVDTQKMQAVVWAPRFIERPKPVLPWWTPLVIVSLLVILCVVCERWRAITEAA